MRLAVIADIHGNAPALAAVLADLSARGANAIVHLGDAANGPVDPAGTLTLLRCLSAVHVRGNGDRLVGAADASAAPASVRFARAHLAPADLAWLAGWPETVGRDGWLACHGSPRSDIEYLVEKVTSAGAAPRPPVEVAAMLGPTAAGLILCGHTHLPRVVPLPDGRLVVNPGSVGLPAYDDDRPHPHKMEAGSPQARYAVVDRTDTGWRATLVAVDYPWEQAARDAERHGFPAWAHALRTGFVPADDSGSRPSPTP